jgi:hypothetical protein
MHAGAKTMNSFGASFSRSSRESGDDGALGTSLAGELGCARLVPKKKDVSWKKIIRDIRNGTSL